MNHWSPDQWSAVLVAALSALTTLLVSVINALKGHADRQEIKERLAAVSEQQAAHERNAERRANLPLAARLRPVAPPSDVREQ